MFRSWGTIGLSIFMKIEGGRGFSWVTSRGMALKRDGDPLALNALLRPTISLKADVPWGRTLLTRIYWIFRVLLCHETSGARGELKYRKPWPWQPWPMSIWLCQSVGIHWTFIVYKRCHDDGGNRGYFERFLHSTLNIFFINCSTDINPTPYLGLNMGPSSFTLKKN